MSSKVDEQARSHGSVVKQHCQHFLFQTRRLGAVYMESRKYYQEIFMPRFYTIPELAESTRMSISYWWKLVKRGDIAVTRIGRCVRVSQESLDEFLSKQKVA